MESSCQRSVAQTAEISLNEAELFGPQRRVLRAANGIHDGNIAVAHLDGLIAVKRVDGNKTVGYAEGNKTVKGG